MALHPRVCSRITGNQIFFRGEYYPAPHIALIEDEVLDKVHKLSALRGPGHSSLNALPESRFSPSPVTEGMAVPSANSSPRRT